MAFLSILEQIKTKYNKWKQQGIIIAGGNGKGDQLNQLYNPEGIFIHENKTIFIADRGNHRIVEWKYGSKSGQIIAGGNGQGNRNDQLYHSTDVIVDKQNNSLIIADYGNRRVMRLFLENRTNQQNLISDIDCWSVKIDKDGFIYVSDHGKDEVRRWKEGDTHGTLVAGGNGRGRNLNQLHKPTYIFVDKDYSVYVSDHHNHRVMKWTKDAKQGIIVAGGNGHGKNLNQLSYPRGVILDHLGYIYVTDCDNHRIMCWYEGDAEGSIVVGGKQSNQLYHPTDLSFDVEGNLYVADWGNNQIRKYEIISFDSNGSLNK